MYVCMYVCTVYVCLFFIGRTAEFTSKIITALHAHAMAGRLISAVKKLPAIDSSSRSKLLKQVSLRELAMVARRPPRLPLPLPPQQALQVSHPEETTTQEIIRSSKKRPLEDIEATIGAYTYTVCHDFRVVIWLPILHTDISVDLELREQLHGIVQLLVCTLWRSKLAKEQQQKLQFNLHKHNSSITMDMDTVQDDNLEVIVCVFMYVCVYTLCVCVVVCVCVCVSIIIIY